MPSWVSKGWRVVLNSTKPFLHPWRVTGDWFSSWRHRVFVLVSPHRRDWFSTSWRLPGQGLSLNIITTHHEYPFFSFYKLHYIYVRLQLRTYTHFYLEILHKLRPCGVKIDWKTSNTFWSKSWENSSTKGKVFKSFLSECQVIEMSLWRGDQR